MDLINTDSSSNFDCLTKSLLRHNNEQFVFGKYKQPKSRCHAIQRRMSVRSVTICFFINRKGDIDCLWNRFSIILPDDFKELIMILGP